MVGLVEVEMNKVEFQSQIISDCNDETDEDSSLSSYICNFYEFYASVGAISLSFTTAPFYRERKLERNFGDPAVGRRVSVRAAAGVLSSFRLNHQSLSPLLFLRFPSVGALVSHQPPWLWFWSHDAFAGRMGRLSCTFSVSGRRRLSQIRRRRSLHPWRGSFLSSAVVGSSPRGLLFVLSSEESEALRWKQLCCMRYFLWVVAVNGGGGDLAITIDSLRF
ncbi:hypothetical protein DY000_02041658 [Brassica cretica]|uniref:Uncharacterized protein n=1 Tax=Brassica cretica TaxID=69181 RepID=A0ABQ7B585_BRACR|nr:hypothetical protein DY000_02041658 [Brassica cretica]